MEISKICSVGNLSVPSFKEKDKTNTERIVVRELHSVVPDYNIKRPQKYTNIGVSELSNGLKIYSYKLANGHRVSIIPMENSPATVKNYVNVGSMNETDDIKGISHFLEHMAFNGTNGLDGHVKLNMGDSFKKIDELGGISNASTNYSVTDYYNTTALLDDADLEKQIEIIASMAEDLTLSSEMIEKEKYAVCSEIDMYSDESFTIASDQTLRTLFNIRSSADEMVAGSVKHIQNLDKDKVRAYYEKYYIPENMHLVITGNVNPQGTIELVAKNFCSTRKQTQNRYEEKLVPISEMVRKDYISDKADSTMIMFGFAGPKVSDLKDTILTQIAMEYLDTGEANFTQELDSYGTKISILGREKISTNTYAPSFLYCGLECSEENSEPVLKVLSNKLNSLEIKNEKTLNNIKKMLIREYNNSLEYSDVVNSTVGISFFNNCDGYLTNYIDTVKSITLEDINNYFKKYMDVSKSAITVVHPEVSPEQIKKNYQKVNNVNFRGKERTPLNLEKVSVQTLPNNYKLALVKSNNENTSYIIELRFPLLKDINPATYGVLEEMLIRSHPDMSYSEYLEYMEDNGMSDKWDLDKEHLAICVSSDGDAFTNSVNAINDTLSCPDFSKEKMIEAVDYIKDNLSRCSYDASDLYNSYESKQNPYMISIEDVLENIDKVTLADVKKLYRHIMNNSTGVITANLPENDSHKENELINGFSELNNVKPYNYIVSKRYVQNNAPVVLTKSKPYAQANINEIFKFESNNSLKEEITVLLMNSILSSSASIGLFNNLREKEHLAYSVHSFPIIRGDLGRIILSIQTTTDNKETGVTSYENLQRSINGFNNQIRQLVNSEYTDEELETAKRALKTQVLDLESTISKLDNVMASISLGDAPDRVNKMFKMIDNITREDIDEMSGKIFSSAPIYSIVASNDTLEYNKEFLESIKE
ncbi:MAG: insulinase family protein [bacterium]|nr:insulinase family protein [bacterium]